MAEPKVLVGAPCGKEPVYDEFYDCFAALITPELSIKTRAKSGSIPINLNALVDAAISNECTHLFVVEDDSFFKPDTLMRLLAHDKPVVAGLCRSRQAPFVPYVYSGVEEDGLSRYMLGADDKGLIKVAATGMGGILINTEVFKQLSRPYFWSYFVGEKFWSQDVVFGKSLIEAGVEVYCDLDVIIEHATQCVLGTERDEDGGWCTTMRVSEAVIKFPQGY